MVIKAGRMFREALNGKFRGEGVSVRYQKELKKGVGRFGPIRRPHSVRSRGFREQRRGKIKSGLISLRGKKEGGGECKVHLEKRLIPRSDFSFRASTTIVGG